MKGSALFLSDWQSISLCNQQDYHNLPFSISRTHSHKMSMQTIGIITLHLMEFWRSHRLILSEQPFWRARGVKYYGYCCLRQFYKVACIPTMMLLSRYTHHQACSFAKQHPLILYIYAYLHQSHFKLNCAIMHAKIIL